MSARVLVVDDILPNVKLLEAKLSNEYYDVLTATSGAQALEIVTEKMPDIVLLDVMMPEMDGFEVCRQIKSNPNTAHIPVVMVTALTEATDRVKGLEVGADDFLSKPLNDTALMARVRSLVRLKMTVDEWRSRETTASNLGVSERNTSAMHESYENARILIIEDEEFESEKMVAALAEDNDDVQVVTNGPNAMGFVTTEDFDIIIVSLDLSEEDGLRLCSHLKSNERTRSIPILMVSHEGDMSRIAHGLEIGTHDYILRPIDKNELLARVRTQIRRKRFQERLRSTYEVNLSLALVDSLTGLYNRRYLEAHMAKLLENNKQSHKMLCVLMMDIDHFKPINDTHGHPVGDEILKAVGERLSNSVRSFDLAARLGGEEFVILLPEITKERVYFVAERLRRAISDVPFPCKVPGGQLAVTVSVGGVLIEDDQEHTIESVLKRVDDALYAAKEGGRNVTFFEGVGRIDPDEFREEKRKTVE